ncbi:unnamed protein product, partial [Ectocarpus sp. 12 AP-2014]
PAIVKKVVSDHAGSSLGEFRHVILAMLDTYSYDTAIHRTAASLLFESLRTVVRERHTLKGAGVRVSAVGGFDLHPPRIAAADGPTGARNTSAAAAAASAAGSLPEQRGGVFSVGGGGGGRSLAPHHPPVPSGLLGAVGSGVISVSSGGVAVVVHLGRGGGVGDASSRNDEGDGDGDDDGSSGAGARRAGSSPPPAAAMPQQDASASLWRLRAARRRRQARGDKMRSLARWSAGEDTGPIRGDGGDRARGTIGHIPVMTRGGSKVSGGGGGGGGALGGDENGRVHQRGGQGAAAAAAAGGAAANQYRREAAAAGEEGQSRGRQALGWGSALQARAALALPASFLTKRT